ncbi:cellulose biosynthesis protein BcsF [Legionella antarctica]|uniref:cellulose biosynthesis protein BcsF n=1 Tax=Legionella antarctica TaxID=2708020 RepID=UPI00156648B6|nr:cellulose biosynthesis protein BcsF [Legionella antarctica]
MQLTDIIQIILFSAVFFFLLGYTLRSPLQRGLKAIKNHLLKPRYLKASGFLSGKNTSTVKKNND